MIAKTQIKEVGKVMVLPDAVRTTFAKAQDISREHDGRLLTLRDAIRALADPDSALSKELKGHCIWLEDKFEFSASGRHRIDYEKGTLVPVDDTEYNGLSFNQKARAWKGSGLLALFIGDSPDTKRMILDATCWPSEVARVVFVPMTQSEREAAALKKVPETISVAKQLARDAETAPTESEKDSSIMSRLDREIRSLDDVTEVKVRPGNGPNDSRVAVYMRRNNEETIEKIDDMAKMLPRGMSHRIIIVPELRDL